VASERPPFPVDPAAIGVLEKLWAAGHAAYLVGGGLRDALLGLSSDDWDVATDARPERILSLFPGGVYQNRFGTVLARGIEITTFRRDHRYADHRRPERVTFTDDVYEDLARRDLTINAIAWGRRPGAATRWLDPADGKGDLEARLVRAVGDPAARFDEDALRLLRAVRIAARLDFTIEPLTLSALRDHAADVAWVSEERVGAEVRRMLESSTPSRAFKLMQDTGILTTILPELSAPEVPTEHAFAALDAAATAAPAATTACDERLELAVLLHVIGPSGARQVLDRLRVPGREAEVICHLIDQLAQEYSPDWSDADVRSLMQRVGRDHIDEMLLLRRIHDGSLGEDARPALTSELWSRVDAQRAAHVPLSLADLAVDGDDLCTVLNIPEGPTVGFVLDRLLEDVIEDPGVNQRMTLLTRANLILDDRPGPEKEATGDRSFG
jgi:poly(A) polymerase/tRNA nucleotidyltransferase (CCA-adding enzyme)